MILIVTNASDLTTDYIVLELQRRAQPYFRLNAEDLPKARVTFGFESACDWSLELGGRKISGTAVSAAYFRRPGTPEIDGGVADKGERAYCAAEWSALLKNLYARLGRRWLSAPATIMEAEDKPRQLLAAKAAGFMVPDAIVTNDIAVADTFIGRGPSVAKPLREALLDGETERVIFTNRVTQASARDARAFAAAPMIIQREIIKHADVRVTVVGSVVLAAAIYSQGAAEAEVDWRAASEQDLPYQAIDLPGFVRAQCIALAAHFELGFGAIDLVWDRDDAFWFLEINPNGQWAWIENRTGLPITATIVDALMDIAER